MLTNEKDVVHWFTRYCKDKGYLVNQVENGRVGRGFPDLLVVTPANDYFFEVKCIRSMLSDLGFRVGQYAWHYNYHRVSGRYVYALIYTKKEGLVFISPLSGTAPILAVGQLLEKFQLETIGL
jgi:hypothetical protein